MDESSFPQRSAHLFVFFMLLMLFVVNGAAVAVAQATGFEIREVAVYSELALALLLAVTVTRLGWWHRIGFRQPEGRRALWIFAPALVLFFGNLTFGVGGLTASVVVSSVSLAVLSGFVEEVIFRGLILHALLVRGERVALFGSTVLFGLAHAGNVLAGSDLLYVALQIGYSLAIGFGFGAMALRARLLWPLAIAHALGNFAAFINAGDASVVTPHMLVVMIVYIVVLVGYGIYLRRSIRPKKPSG